MKNNIAFVFPGQGSQSVGMLSNIDAQYSIVQELFEQASEILQKDLWQIVSDGPVEILNQTVYTQPVMLVSDIAFWRISQQKGDLQPSLLAGHSLGEYSALVAADVIAFHDAVKLVDFRARTMQNAVPEGVGAMAVILGLSNEKIQEICEKASNDDSVEPVNFNSPGQTVVAGHVAAVDQVIELAKSSGAKRAMKLPVSVPSHSRLMEPAAEVFSKFLQTIQFQLPKIPVINNVDVKVEQEPSKIKDALVSQLYRPVRWIETVQYMIDHGIQQIYECGPGKVLTGLNKRIDSNIECFSLNESIKD